MSDKKKAQENPNDLEDSTSLREQAINKSETEGKKINHQVKQRKEQHQPRDTA